MSRLSILENSLTNKQAALDAAIATHFDSVKAANGQPLNDKRNGKAALVKWEKQNNKIRNIQEEIEKTKAAIEREQYKVNDCAAANDILPAPILAAINRGDITQWRRYPNRFFIPGVDKARIIWDVKKGFLTHQYLSSLDKEQYKIFRDVYNRLKAEISPPPEPTPEPTPVAQPAISVSRAKIQFARWHHHRHSAVAMSDNPAPTAFIGVVTRSSTHLDADQVVTISNYYSVIDGTSLNLHLVSTTRNGITTTIADDSLVAISHCTPDCRIIVSHPCANTAIPCPIDAHVYPVTRTIQGVELKMLLEMPKPAAKRDTMAIDHRHVSHNFHACIQAAIKTGRNIAVHVDPERLTISAGSLKYRLPWCTPIISEPAAMKTKKPRLTTKQKIAIEIAALMDRDDEGRPIACSHTDLKELFGTNRQVMIQGDTNIVVDALSGKECRIADKKLLESILLVSTLTPA